MDNQEFSSWMRNFYNNKAKVTYGGEYEYNRWLINKIKRKQYRFSIQSYLFHLRDINFKNALEIGCGPGTWTRLLLKRYPEAKITTTDISEEMINQLKKRINDKRVKTKVINFLEFPEKEKFDFIFFSRAIEYIPNKSKVIEKIYNLLESSGKCLIITSPPHPKTVAIKKFFGKKINLQHTQRISVKEMEFLLKKQGFKNIKFYPVLFVDFFLVPNSLLFKFLYKRKWGLLSKMFASSYLVKFEKP